MFVLSWLARAVSNTLQRRALDDDLNEELRSYVELAQDEHRAHGLSPEQARRAALAELRGVQQVKERVQDVRSGALLEQLSRDLAYGVRMAFRNRGFTAVAVVTLALGIGAATATFSIVDTIVFRPLPYADTNRLVKIWAGTSPRGLDDVSFPDFADIRRDGQAFEQVAADDGHGFRIEYGGARESANGALVTPDWLTTLGVQPSLGRGFVAGEDQPGRNHVVVLTDQYWRRRFGADPGIVGQTLRVDGTPAAVVGVLPPNVLRYGADFLTPLVPAEYAVRRDHSDLDVFARLRRGTTIAAAQAELDVIGRRLALEYPATNADRRFRLMPLDKYYASVHPSTGRGLLLMLGAVGFVLLIACVNVANLLLARAAARGRECVIRTALGASRARIVGQLLIENMVLFAAGGALGSLLAWWSVDSLVAFAVAAGYVPDRLRIAVDGRVLAVSFGLSIVIGATVGLGPALRASRVDFNQGLRDAMHAGRGGPRRARVRRLLMASELTLSVVLLVGFGLLTRSFVSIYANSAGFDPSRLLETGSDGGRDFDVAVQFWTAALERTRALSGVESAAVSSRPPVHGGRRQRFELEGQAGSAVDPGLAAGDILISADYFRTMGIDVLEGRPFTERDSPGAAPVAIVSDTFARRHFPGQSPIGRRLRLLERTPMTCCAAPGPVENVWREIVGVASDIRQANLDEAPAATIYRPYSQIVEHDMFLMVRTRTDADVPRVAAALPSALRAVDPAGEWWDVRPMRQVIADSESIRLRRFVLVLLGGFAVLALVLAAVGLYGVMTYFVVERRRELAVRVALGATKRAVLEHVLGEATRLLVLGLVTGVLAARLLTGLIASMLFGVSPTDAATYGLVCFTLGSVTMLASYIPARRAAAVDPLIALKEA